MATPPNRVYHPAEVFDVRDVAPRMRRISVRSSALRGMAADLPGQWMKVSFPVEPGEKAHGRAYTIRRHDREAGTMELDFVLHGDEARASRWAGQARAGETIGLAGPRDGYAINPERGGHVLVGDSTSLPAIAAILEALPAGVPVLTFIEVPDREEASLLPARTGPEPVVLVSGDRAAGTTGQLLRAVREARLPPSPQAWVAGEATMMRAVRDHLTRERGIDPRAIAASGYWRVGVEDHRDLRPARGGERRPVSGKIIAPPPADRREKT